MPVAGQVFSKSTYNGVNWVTGSYQGYNTSGTSYSQAGTVANDVIVTQLIPTYDEAGNVISNASYDRLNDAPATGTGSTGALSYGSNPQGPRLRTHAAWFDGIDRSVGAANYGGDPSSFTRPSTIPSSSSTLLVNLTAYDDASRVYQDHRPDGGRNQTTYDNAGRTTQTIEDAGSGHLNRTTNYTYTLDNLVATLVAVNATTGDQTTTYTYGTTLTESEVARNDLLRYGRLPGLRQRVRSGGVRVQTAWASSARSPPSAARSAPFITTSSPPDQRLRHHQRHGHRCCSQADRHGVRGTRDGPHSHQHRQRDPRQRHGA